MTSEPSGTWGGEAAGGRARLMTRGRSARRMGSTRESGVDPVRRGAKHGPKRNVRAGLGRTKLSYTCVPGSTTP